LLRYLAATARPHRSVTLTLKRDKSGAARLFFFSQGFGISGGAATPFDFACPGLLTV